MGNFKKSIDKKLALRREEFDERNYPPNNGYTRPGSRNPHKQGASVGKKGR